VKILFATTPATGHVQPVLGLALAAREAGHGVAWASGREAQASLQAHGIRFFGIGSPWEEVRRTYREKWLQGRQLQLQPRESTAFSFPHLFGEVAFNDMLEPLTAVVADWRPDLVVHEIGCLAAPLASRVNGVPHVSHAFGLPLPTSSLESANTHIAPAWAARGLPAPLLCGLFDHGAIEFAPPALRALSAHKAQAAKVWWQRPASVSASPGATLAAPLQAFLDAAAHLGRPVVYVTFGTVFNAAASFDSVIEAARQTNAAFVATTGVPGAFGPAPRDRASLPANVWLEEYVPQSLLLPRCAAVISHGGSGTAFGAASHGLPQLFIPQGADQFRNADAFVAAGAALLLEGPAATPQAIAAATLRLIEDTPIRAAAQRLRHEIDHMPTPADTVHAMSQHFGASSTPSAA
jgi:UDP:flavonoid glycosyltransferase YjiC (YdhE family)